MMASMVGTRAQLNKITASQPKVSADIFAK
jgi:hypothetical protein